jgi:hypothetical protein
MLGRLQDELAYWFSNRQVLAWSVVGGAVLLIALVLVFAIPWGGGRPREAAASLMRPDTQLYFSLNLRPPGGQLRKMGKLIGALAGNPDAMEMWDEWMAEAEREMGIDLEREVLPWLGPEVAIGLAEWGAEEGEFLIVLETRDVMGASRAFAKWRMYLEDVLDMEWSVSRTRDREVWAGETYYGERQIYALTADRILIANREQTMWEALTRIESGGPSLASSSWFSRASTLLPEERIGTLIVDGRSVFSDMVEYQEEYYGSGDAPIVRVVRPLIPEFASGAIVLTDGGVEFSLAAPTPAALDVAVAGPSSRVAEMIPASVAFCVAGRDAYSVWTGMREEISMDPRLEDRVDDSMEDLRYDAGFDLDDRIWRHFRGDFAVAGIGDFPDLAGVIAVEDELRLQGELRGLLQRIAETQYEMSIDEVQIDGVTATAIQSEDLSYDGFSPSYAFLGKGFLAFGLTRDALRAVIRTYQGRYESLADAESYRGAMDEMGRSHGWIGYACAPSVIDYLLSGLDPWERDVLEDLPSIEDVVCDAGFAFSIGEQLVSASVVVLLCAGR